LADKTRCLLCARITTAKYYSTHKEQVLKSVRQYRITNKEAMDKYYQSYRAARKESMRQYNRVYREKNKARHKDTRLKKLYGITIEQRKALLKEQGGLCAICKKPQRLIIDHDHADGHVRQLLCDMCNTGLGCFNDSQQLLEAAVRYLRKHSQLRLVG